MPRKTRGKTTSKTVHTARAQRYQPTPAEQKLWSALRDRHLAGLKFRRQHPFGPYVLDYFCVEHQLEVEADGGIHLAPDQQDHDANRAEYLQEHGVRILRFTNEEIMNDFYNVLKRIAQATCPPSPDANSSVRRGG
jgi:adenine-specific DNA-methyltransferase